MKIWKQRPHDEAKEKLFIQQGKSKVLSRLLSQRNIDCNNLDDFIRSEYQKMSSPFSLHDVEKAAKIFLSVAKEKGKVAVIGDYDADGIIGSTMIKELCICFGLECQVFLPSRLDHGYGLSPTTVKAFIEKLKFIPDLLIVVDCGTNNKNEIEQLRMHGIKKIVIIDHHISGENHALNADALVSWHLGGSHEMCSCGEIYQFIRGIHQMDKRVSPIEFLTYAAVGTIADMSPIIRDNRIIVKNGLTSFAITHIKSSGLIALMKQSRINVPALTQIDVSFKIAPKINAAGRIFLPDIVYGLLIERDPNIASKIAEYIGTYNDERKTMQRKIEGEAIICAECDLGDHSHGVLVSSDSWHIGVVGIVASRLTEVFNKPSIVVGKHNGSWRGSGRSVSGVNIKEILDTCPEIFEKYGGHAGAVGVTIKPECISTASTVFNDACKRYYEKHNIEKDVCSYYDAKINGNLVDPKMMDLLSDNLYPYCNENNVEPIFLLPNAIIHNTSINEGSGWKLMTFYVNRGMSIPYPFKMFSPTYGTEIEGRKADIYFSFPQKYEMQPNKYAQFELMVSDIILK